MHKAILEVAIGKLDPAGRRCCKHCGERLIPGVPTNYPQVCQPCADKYVWQFDYSDRQHKGKQQ